MRQADKIARTAMCTVMYGKLRRRRHLEQTPPGIIRGSLCSLEWEGQLALVWAGMQGGREAEVTLASAWSAVKAGLSPHVLSNFLVLGLPGGVMMAADACSFDVTTVMASILGEPGPHPISAMQ